MSKLIDLTGKRFGRLTVQRVVTGSRPIKWHCLCDCGNEVDVNGTNLKSGRQVSCGCYHSDMARSAHTTHGLSKTRLHGVWWGMKQRCYYKRHVSYPLYGGAGIGVCDEWRNDFLSFYTWAIENGYQEGLSIDRINQAGDYSPENCRWETPTGQACNRKSNLVFEHGGKTQTLKQWSVELGIEYGTLYYRVKRGVPFEQAIVM